VDQVRYRTRGSARLASGHKLVTSTGWDEGGGPLRSSRKMVCSEGQVEDRLHHGPGAITPNSRAGRIAAPLSAIPHASCPAARGVRS
jgi:hypothetical protein